MSDNTRFADVIQKYRDVFKLLAAMEDDNASYLLLLESCQRSKKTIYYEYRGENQ